MNEIRKWGDEQQFYAEPQQTTDRGVQPSVSLLWMTPDPLGAIAAMSEMYKGNVIRNLADLTDDQRQSALEDVQKTHLRAPLEAVKLHFMIEGVDRAFTHQLVRQRTAVYAQESLRFAVVGQLEDCTTLPASLAGLPAGAPERRIWSSALSAVDAAYHQLVDAGVPAEDARGLLPHCTATRLNYITDLRNLAEHAGNRLCTQAQFHWRLVFAQIVNAIRNYGEQGQNWQFQALAESALFRPVCYAQNKCPFKASFDRHCSIQQRVDAFEKKGIPSNEWEAKETIGRIDIAEWALNPDAARVRTS